MRKSLKIRIKYLASMIIVLGLFFLPPVYAQEADSCRSVLKHDGTLRFQECNNTKIKRIVPVSNGFINISLNSSETSNLWCAPFGIDNQLLIHKDNPNIDSIYAILLNAHEKQRPIKAVRLIKTVDPNVGTATTCIIESVTSDL